MDNYNRRNFLGNAVKAGVAGLIFFPLPDQGYRSRSLTVNQVIEKILAELPGKRQQETVDTLKSGKGDQLVTGIVTTMFATIEVIREAIKINANFIIAHEPTFYNHPDDVNWVENNEVAKEKLALLEEHQIVIWRFHDYWHAIKPDGILHGVLLKTGWLRYDPREERVFRIPGKPLAEIIRDLKTALNIPHLRYIGDLNTNCSVIALMPGAVDGHEQLNTLISGDADLIIVGETREWELPEYVRDARLLGKKVSMIVLGHAYSEEPGMEYLVSWLKPKVPEIPLFHIPSGEPFRWE
jgi:putative NIF3 family GTP cyclohydrolase 1 type 2